MSGMLHLVFMLLSSAWVLTDVGGLIVAASGSERQGKTTKVASQTLTFASLRSYSEELANILKDQAKVTYKIIVKTHDQENQQFVKMKLNVQESEITTIVVLANKRVTTSTKFPFDKRYVTVPPNITSLPLQENDDSVSSNSASLPMNNSNSTASESPANLPLKKKYSAPASTNTSSLPLENSNNSVSANPSSDSLDNSYDTASERTSNIETLARSNNIYSGNDYKYDTNFIEESDGWNDNEKYENMFSSDIPDQVTSMLKSHGDIFPCPPCNCSYTANRFVIANCTYRKINYIPLTLPANTMTLNLSYNRFEKLNISNLLQYSFLHNISVTDNKGMTEISNSSLGNQTSNIRYMNVSSCAIKTINDNSFRVMSDLAHLIISFNKLTNLTKYVFTGIEKLQTLDLSKNDLYFIENGTFDKLINLKNLDLSQNRRLGYSSRRFSPSLFAHLIHLQKFSIYGNSAGSEMTYPNEVLQQLVELKELNIDGLGRLVEFGPQMKSLKHLISLTFCGNCYIKNITENFFENIPCIKSFRMHLCASFAYVHPKAYTKLRDLQSLSISYMTNYDIDTAFRDLAGINNNSLKSLTFIHLRQPVHQCKFLGAEHTIYLRNMSVEHLDLSDNSIALLGNDFLETLPPNLQKLVLRKNKLMSSTMPFYRMAVLKEVKEIDLTIQNVDDFRYHFSQNDESISNCTDRTFDSMEEIIHMTEDTESRRGYSFYTSDRSNSQLQFGNLEEHNDLDNKKGDQQDNPYNSILFPPKLKILRASQYNAFGMQILKNPKIRDNRVLQTIDFSNSFMSTWGLGGMPKGIIEANLGSNYCKHILQTFFQPNNSHIRIFLNNNFLGPDFAGDKKGALLSRLAKVKYLDISTNLIYSLPWSFFKGLLNLKYLKLSDNKLYKLNISLAHMRDLQFIDLSHNSISWIGIGTRNDLDNLAVLSGENLRVDLTYNPLPCTCAGLDIISWMASTKVVFHNQNLLTCTGDNMVSEPIGDLEKRRELLQRYCTTKSLFIVGCISAIAVVMVIVGFVLMYRYRWKLRYLYNTAMASLFGFTPDVASKSGCTFDAYIVYTQETRDFVLKTCLKELELKRGHRICVEDRDFLAGTYIVSSIVSAIRNSTKTVPVMTPDFFREMYSEYSFKMAIMEEMYKNREVLHLLLYKPIPNDEMSHDELRVMKRNSYIEFPPENEVDDNVKNKFWDELSQTIGHTGNSNREPVLEM